VTYKLLITDAAGFIGCNVAARFVEQGKQVTTCDNLSPYGSEKNLRWLRETFGTDGFEFPLDDVCDKSAILPVVKNSEIIIHVAGQVAVTTSVPYPRMDFENNVLGTFNVFESARVAALAHSLVIKITSITQSI
jgi:CDP-paratose 2-epimerase